MLQILRNLKERYVAFKKSVELLTATTGDQRQLTRTPPQSRLKQAMLFSTPKLA